MRNINKEKIQKIREKWLYIPNPQSTVKNRVFCLHYAAVSAEVYHNWCFLFDEGTEVCCVQLPGRSTRSHENIITVMEELVSLIAEVILSYNDVPYVIFGHCRKKESCLSRSLFQEKIHHIFLIEEIFILYLMKNFFRS